MPPEDRDADTIADKRGFERAVADDLAAKLKAWHPENGSYTIAVTGSYPVTKLHVTGLNVRTDEPSEWGFALWDFLSSGTPDDTATIIYAQMAV